MDALRLQSERHGATLVIKAQGDIDIVTSGQFDSYLAQARRECQHIILDLGAVDFMDTSSLAVIVAHWKKLAGQGGTLSLAGPRYRYTKTLWITGLANKLPLYDTVGEALKSAPAAAGPGE